MKPTVRTGTLAVGGTVVLALSPTAAHGQGQIHVVTPLVAPTPS